MGRAKAAVLPVPVWAMPSRSLPKSTLGMAWVWIGVGIGVAFLAQGFDNGGVELEVGKSGH